MRTVPNPAVWRWCTMRDSGTDQLHYLQFVPDAGSGLRILSVHNLRIHNHVLTLIAPSHMFGGVRRRRMVTYTNHVCGLATQFLLSWGLFLLLPWHGSCPMLHFSVMFLLPLLSWKQSMHTPVSVTLGIQNSTHWTSLTSFPEQSLIASVSILAPIVSLPTVLGIATRMSMGKPNCGVKYCILTRCIFLSPL